MASPFTPQLTAWRAAGRDCVEHKGTVYAVQRHRREDDDEFVVEDARELVEIGGEVFAVADEKEVAVHNGRVVRCVEYPGSGAALLLTVTERAEKEQAEGAEEEVVMAEGAEEEEERGEKVVAEVEPNGALRVLESGGSYDTAAGTWEHFVDVQGKSEAFVLQVSVREEEDEARIVRVERLN